MFCVLFYVGVGRGIVMDNVHFLFLIWVHFFLSVDVMLSVNYNGFVDQDYDYQKQLWLSVSWV